MPVERRGQPIRVMINLVNWQQEELTGCGGGRQLSLDGTSRVTGDWHAPVSEPLGVKFPGPTRRRSAMVVPTATRTGLWKVDDHPFPIWGAHPIGQHVVLSISSSIHQDSHTVPTSSRTQTRATRNVREARTILGWSV